MPARVPAPGAPAPMPPGGIWPALPTPADPATEPLPAVASPVPSGRAGVGPRPWPEVGVGDGGARPGSWSTAGEDGGIGEDGEAGEDGNSGNDEDAAGGRRVRRALAGLVPAGWRGARLDPGRPGATALALVAALAAVAAAVGVWLDRPRAEPLAALPAVVVPADAAPAPTVEPAAPVPLVVSVSGRVARPGLVELVEGARVADALDAVGGALPGTDLSLLNLARRVVDGEQIAVGVPPAPDAAGAPAAGGAAPAAAPAGSDAGPVDLNSAGLDQLDALPGVGPVTAQSIVDWRTRNGRFTRVEQLREVEGIGERRFAQLRELVVVR